MVIAQFMPHLRKCGVARCGVGHSAHATPQNRINFRTAKMPPPISQKLSRALLTGMVVRYKFAQKALNQPGSKTSLPCDDLNAIPAS